MRRFGNTEGRVMRREHQGGVVTGNGTDEAAEGSPTAGRDPLALPRRPGTAERKLRSATAAGLVAAIALGGGVVAPVTRAALGGGAAQALADTVPDVDGLSSWLGVSGNRPDAPSWLGPSPLRLHSPAPAATAGGRTIDAGQ